MYEFLQVTLSTINKNLNIPLDNPALSNPILINDMQQFSFFFIKNIFIECKEKLIIIWNQNISNGST